MLGCLVLTDSETTAAAEQRKGGKALACLFGESSFPGRLALSSSFAVPGGIACLEGDWQYVVKVTYYYFLLERPNFVAGIVQFAYLGSALSSASKRSMSS